MYPFGFILVFTSLGYIICVISFSQMTEVNYQSFHRKESQVTPDGKFHLVSEEPLFAGFLTLQIWERAELVVDDCLPTLYWITQRNVII